MLSILILNYIILNNILRHDVVTYTLLKPLFVVIKLQSFILPTVFHAVLHTTWDPRFQVYYLFLHIFFALSILCLFQDYYNQI